MRTFLVSENCSSFVKMGSEQSSQSNSSQSGSKNPKLKRGKSVPESSWPRNSQDGQQSKAASANTSPGHSVCSDVDLPYISYTVNRPIGGIISPKIFRSVHIIKFTINHFKFQIRQRNLAL